MREITTPRVLVLSNGSVGDRGDRRVSRTLVRALTERYGADRVGVVSLWGGVGDLPARILHRGRASADYGRSRWWTRQGSPSPRSGSRADGAVAWSSSRVIRISRRSRSRPLDSQVRRSLCGATGKRCGDRSGRRSASPFNMRISSSLRVVSPRSRRAPGRASIGSRWSCLMRCPSRSWRGPERRASPGTRSRGRTMGSRDRGKGIDTLLRAWPEGSRYPTPRGLVVVGDGEDRERLEEATLGIRIERRCAFVGHLDDSDLRELYRTADVFALPTERVSESTLAGEGFGLCSSKPPRPVFRSLPDARPQFPRSSRTPQTGLLVDPTDPDAVADAIGRLLDRSEAASPHGAGRSSPRRRVVHVRGLRRSDHESPRQPRPQLQAGLR